MSALVRFLLQLNYGKSDKGRGGPHRFEGRPISYTVCYTTVSGINATLQTYRIGGIR